MNIKTRDAIHETTKEIISILNAQGFIETDEESAEIFKRWNNALLIWDDLKSDIPGGVLNALEILIEDFGQKEMLTQQYFHVEFNGFEIEDSDSIFISWRLSIKPNHS